MECKIRQRRLDSSYRAIKSFELCDCRMYPTLHVLLRILITLPLSATSIERSFSTLKSRLDTWFESTIVVDRLIHWAYVVRYTL